MPTSSEQVEELIDLLGDPAAVLTDDLDRFAEPARGLAGPLDLVVLPRDTEQVRLVVGWARRHHIRLLPQGANTGLVGASTPGAEGGVVVLSTVRLLGEPLIDPVDRTVIVHAGTPLSELNEQLAGHGLSLPIDLGADPCIGGMVATNTGGARMLRHGDMRSHVLGVRAVIADEDVSVIDELSVLRKDNTGLALTQLLVGSGGSLGVITRVALRVDPLASRRGAAWLAPVHATAALDILLVLEQTSRDRLSAFEVVSKLAMDTTLEHVAGLHRPFGGQPVPEWSVLVEFEGDDGTEDALVEALAHLDSLGLISDAVLGPPQQIWAVRHSITEGLRRAGTVIGFDVSVPRSSLPAFLATTRERVHELLPRTFVADFGHWGDGGVHCSVVVPVDAPLDPVERRALRDLVFGIAVDDHRGSFSGEHGLGPVNADWWRRTTSPGSQLLSRRIKEACDPLDILGHPGMPYSWADGPS